MSVPTYFTYQIPNSFYGYLPGSTKIVFSNHSSPLKSKINRPPTLRYCDVTHFTPFEHDHSPLAKYSLFMMSTRLLIKYVPTYLFNEKPTLKHYNTVII